MSEEKIETPAIDRDNDLRIVRIMLLIVVLGLLISGLTCYFLPWEVKTVLDVVWNRSPETIPLMGEEYELFIKVENGLAHIERDFPEFLLGTDWLGFAHVMLAILFLGAMRDPSRNIWIIQFGMISAALVVPAAFLFGAIRGLPTIHYFIDAGFGFGAFIPLYVAYRSLR